MNAPARLGQSPVEEFVGKVLDADRMDELRRSLPKHIRPELFQRNLLNAVMINPELMDYAPGLLFREVSKAAALGLYLDPQLGEAYILIAYNYKTKSKEPQLRAGYRGMIKLARQSGDVLKIYAREVRANDKIRCVQGSTEELVHEPVLFSERGDVVGYYAVIKYTTGETDFEPMDVGQIHAIRDRSDGWKAFVEKKIRSTPWSTDEDEMSKKTVLRRLVKRSPQSPQLAEAIRIEDAAEHSDMVRAPAPRPPKPTVPSEPAQITQRAAVTIDVAAQQEPAMEEDASRSPPPKPPAPPSPAASTKTVAEPPDPEALRKQFETAAKAAQDIDALNEAWMRIVDPVKADIFPPDEDDLMSIFRRREHELEP